MNTRQKLHLIWFQQADYRRLTVRDRKDWAIVSWCLAIGAVAAVVGVAL